MGETYSILQKSSLQILSASCSFLKTAFSLALLNVRRMLLLDDYMNTISFHSLFYRDSATRFFASGFFHESSSPKWMKITLGSFRFFSKTCRDIHKSRCITHINDSGSKCSYKYRWCCWCTTGVNYTISEFVTGINDTGCKFSHRYHWCCWYRCQICHRSMIPAANLPPVSTTPVANNGTNIRLLTPEVKLK